MNPSDEKIFKSLLRTDFLSFVKKVFHETESEIYQHNWHIELLCSELNKLIHGPDTQLIINLPPRYMKSIICSIAFPSWILGHYPHLSIITASYSEKLSITLVEKCRKVIESKWYKNIFPMTKLVFDSASYLGFRTTKKGGLLPTSVSGSVTGIGADFIIVDDPIKPNEAYYEKIRNGVNGWFNSTLRSRLNNREKGKILLVMQRLHEEDLTGFLLDSGTEYKHISLPAIATRDETWVIEDPIRLISYTASRKKGDSLHPLRENIQTLEAIRNNIGVGLFDAQYQQFSDKKINSFGKYRHLSDLIPDIRSGRLKVKNVYLSLDFIITNDIRPYTSIFIENKNGIFYRVNFDDSTILHIDTLTDEVFKIFLELKEKVSVYADDVVILVSDTEQGHNFLISLRQKHNHNAVIVKKEMFNYQAIYKSYEEMKNLIKMLEDDNITA